MRLIGGKEGKRQEAEARGKRQEGNHGVTEDTEEGEAECKLEVVEDFYVFWNLGLHLFLEGFPTGLPLVAVF